MKKMRYLATAVLFAAFIVLGSVNAQTDFSDVAPDAWYADDVESCCTLGLMEGIGDGQFSPDGEVTLAETVTLAARMHARNTGKTIAQTGDGGEWYAPYVVYAEETGILSETVDVDRPAMRYEAAVLFAKALDTEHIAPINEVKSIPDVPQNCAYYGELLALYKAGIVMGNDAYGYFYPDETLTRAEIAAIVCRAAVPEKRLQKSLLVVADDDAYYLCYNPNGFSSLSGFLLDTRGAVPKNDYRDPFSGLYDISDDAPTALIREFNDVKTGVVTLETSATVYGDGAYLEFRGASGETVWKLTLSDGKWHLLDGDGADIPAADANDPEDEYDVRAHIDLVNGRAKTYVNGVFLGEYPLPAAQADILSFRFATTAPGKAVIRPHDLYVYANYAVNESFPYVSDGNTPFDWTCKGAAVSDGVLTFAENGSAFRAFDPQSGCVVFEWEQFLPERAGDCVTLTGSGRTVMRFAADETGFSVNGENVYPDAVRGLWYRLRAEADFASQTLRFKLNGRVIATLPFAEPVSFADALSVTGENGALFDDFKVFRTVEHDDYVPEPKKPRGEEKYTLGLNVCSLWVNGTHAGWGCISAFDDNEPVLGYYDEGNPETADWEIKLMTEHGIDFQAFCWYADNASAPIKDCGLSYQLYDGYMNAKYSDRMKYCIIMECANGAVPDSFASWRDYYVPYLIENFFKDDRYMVIDNRPVFCSFGQSTMTKAIGGPEEMYKAFAYLDEEVKKLGFDGMLYLVGSGKASADFGSAGGFAYSFAQAGYSPEVNKSRNLSNARAGFAYWVPTVSVGFNEVAWAGKRTPLMTVSDYRDTHTWVRDEYLPAYARKDWQKGLVWISTWNEYGEGTYVMPTTGDNGFGYLDVLREIYTDEGTDTSVDVVPTASQRERINHLYPQYRHELRRKVIYEPEMKTAYRIDYATHASGTSSVDLNSVQKTENGYTARASGNDPMIIVNKNQLTEEINLLYVPRIVVTMKGTMGDTVEIFYKTSNNDSWTQGKSTSFSLTGDGMERYVISTDGLADWNGILTGIRIDPAQTTGREFTVKSLELFTDYKETMLSKRMTVDGKSFLLPFAPERTANDGVSAVFDPQSYLDQRLLVFYEWDKDAGVLSLAFKDHTAIFTLGEKTFLFDGKLQTLAAPLAETDGLPVLPLEKLCGLVGYAFSVDGNNGIVIETPRKAYFDALAETRALGVWEFDTPGDAEGWTSAYMRLSSDKGRLIAVSNSDFTDPIIWSATGIRIPADTFNKLEVRVRYSYKANRANPIQLYYITDKDGKWNESKALNLQLASTDSQGEFEEYTLDLTKEKNWKDTVTRLRFDPFNASGTMEVDYIRFVYDPALDEAAGKED